MYPLTRIKQMLIIMEGCKTSAYKDHLGYLTIGVGRLIDARKGGGLSKDEIDLLLSNDVNQCIMELEHHLPYFKQLTEYQQEALIYMVFQLGIDGFMNFKKMLKALESNDLINVEREIINSKWNEQTPTRSRIVIDLLCKS